MTGGLGLGGFPGYPARVDPAPGPGGAAGFDVGELGQMLTQLGQMLSQAGTRPVPVNYDLAKQIAAAAAGHRQGCRARSSARPSATRSGSPSSGWTRPPFSRRRRRPRLAWSPSDWVEATLPTWQRLCDPVARRVSGAWVEGLPEEVRQVAGPMLAMLGQMGGLAFGSQLGAGARQLGAEVLTSTDVGVPLGPEGTAALLPAAIEKFTEGLDRPAGEVMVYLAAREAAHHRLFAHAPWLRERLLAIVEEYAAGITVDTSRIEEIARQIDPADPARSRRPCARGCSSSRPPPSSRPPWRGWRRCWRWSRAGWTSWWPRRSATGCPAPTRCARRCAGGARRVARPSRPSRRSSGWSCGRGGCGRPPSSGGRSASSAGRPGATRCGRTPT